MGSESLTTKRGVCHKRVLSTSGSVHSWETIACSLLDASLPFPFHQGRLLDLKRNDLNHHWKGVAWIFQDGRGSCEETWRSASAQVHTDVYEGHFNIWVWSCVRHTLFCSETEFNPRFLHGQLAYMLNPVLFSFCPRRTWDVDEYQKKADEKAAQRDEEVLLCHLFPL
jgi:hypothetical protein